MSFRGLGMLLAGLAALALGAQPSGRLGSRVYGVDHGLRLEWIQCLAQDSRGLLWIGAADGLLRFDGRTFVRTALPGAQGIARMASSNQGLWVATDDDRLLRLEGDGALRWVRLPTGPLGDMGLDARDRLWIMVGGRVFAQGPDLSFREAGGPEGLTGLAVDADQGLWAVDGRDLWRKEEAGEWRRIPGPRLVGDERLRQVAVDGEGHVWVGALRRIFQWDPKELWRPRPVGEGPYLRAFYRDGLGGVWITGFGGTHRVRGGQIEGIHLGKEGIGALVWGLQMDQEGGLWAGEGQLHYLYWGSPWRLHSVQEGGPQATWQVSQDPRGRIWVAGNAGLVVSQGDGWRAVIPNVPFLRAAVAPDGAIWAGGYPYGRFFRVDPVTLRAQRVEIPELPPGEGSTRGFAFDTHGGVWVSDRQGRLFRGQRSGSGWRWEGQKVAPLHAPLRGILSDAAGRVFLMHAGGVLVREGREWHPLPDLADQPVQRIIPGPDGRLYVAYAGSPVVTLHRIEHGIWRRERRVELPVGELQVEAMAVDGEGILWLSTSDGVLRVDLQKGGQPLRFGAGDGPPSSLGSELGLLVDRGGRLWVSTASGLASFTRRIEAGPRPLPAPCLMEVRSAKEDRPPGPSGEWRSHEPLNLRFAVPSYRYPSRLRYQVRVEGIDSDWQTLERPEAHLGALPVGQWRIRARGLLLGAGPGAESELLLRVLPLWYETWWVRGLGVVLLLGAGALGVLVRDHAMRRHNLELQALVEARSVELRDANRELKAATQAKSEFLASMSHELRTPLNAVLLYGELICDTAANMGYTEILADTRHIQDAGRHLLGLINGILDLSKIEAGKMAVDWAVVALPGLVEEVSAATRPLVAAHANRLQIQTEALPREFRTDPLKLKQVLINLIGNASKFTEAGTITLRFRRESEGLYVEVEDTGVGMTEAVVERLFSPYEQGDAASRAKHGGTGLGLAISHQFVALLGGTLNVYSRPGVGTRFAFTLPWEAEPGSGRSDSPSK